MGRQEPPQTAREVLKGAEMGKVIGKTPHVTVLGTNAE